jgi:hypothetical protein
MTDDYTDAVKQSFGYNDPTIAWNAAIEAAASCARSWGPPNWSASESSLIIKDTCDDLARAILELKK